MGRRASAGPGLRAASGGFGRPGPRRQPRGAVGPRSWVGVLGLLHLAALRGGVEAGHCCPGADLFITKFAQLDHAPDTPDLQLLGMRPGHRALEIFNPSCEAIELAQYEIALVNPTADVDVGERKITRVNLDPGTHTGGRGKGAVWNVPATIPSGGTFVLCTYPTPPEDSMAAMMRASRSALAGSSLLPGDLALSAFANCTAGALELTFAAPRESVEGGSILLVKVEMTNHRPEEVIVDAIAELPHVDEAGELQECSVAALRLEQVRHGNGEYTPAEWVWVYGSACPSASASLTVANADNLCDGEDDKLYIGPLAHPDYFGCEDWRFYDCTLVRKPCTDGENLGCSYTLAEQMTLMASCPHSCGLCVSFGEAELPRRDVVDAAVEADPELLYPPEEPDGVCTNRGPDTPVGLMDSDYLNPAPVEEPVSCCDGAFPTISMFAQLGVEPYPQRAIEIFNPSCEPARFEEFELVFVGQNRTQTVVPLNDIRLFKSDELASGDTLVLCSDFAHNMDSHDVFSFENPTDPNVNPNYLLLVQFIEEESLMPADMVSSTWQACSGNMTQLPRGGVQAVALRRTSDDAIVDLLRLDVPPLAGEGADLACSMAWTRKAPDADILPGAASPVLNSPSFNATQWSTPLVGAGCSDSTPRGWRDSSDVELGSSTVFGQRQHLHYGQKQCAAPVQPLPGGELIGLAGRVVPKAECCAVGYPMISKMLQVDVAFASAATGRYQQRAIEIYNPTCKSVPLSGYELIFLDSGKRTVGTVPLIAEDSQLTLGPLGTHVICAQKGTTHPNLGVGSGDVATVAHAAKQPIPIVSSADTACSVTLTAPDGAGAWLALPGLHGTVALRMAPRHTGPKGADTLIVDVLEHVPELHRAGSSERSCNVAWVREQRIRTSNAAFNESDWIKMTGADCDAPADKFIIVGLDRQAIVFGERDWKEGVELDVCAGSRGLLASVYGVIAPPPEASNSSVPAAPRPCPGGGPRPCNNGGRSLERGLLDAVAFLIFVIIGGCFICACVVCCWIRQRRRNKFQSLEGMEMQLNLGAGLMTSTMTLPSSDGFFGEEHSGFTVTLGAGELREQISRDVRQGGNNVTPWGGAFIMDDMATSDSFEDKVVVGKGSYGTVYKASYRGHVVAVKEIEIEFNPPTARQNDSSQAALREFKQELGVWCKLMHPNVVQFYGYTTEPIVCIVQEFIVGGTLYDLLMGDKPMDGQLRLQFASNVAQGMEYLHGLSPPILHRDLKSLNLLVAEMHGERVIKLTDFGLARSKQTVMGETAKMTQVGTPYWTAPEIFDDAVYNESADVYSFAMVLYEIWARKLPWQGLQPVQVALKVVNERDRPPIPADMEQGVNQLMGDCWVHEPELRPTFTDIVERCEQLRLEGGEALPAMGSGRLSAAPARSSSDGAGRYGSRRSRTSSTSSTGAGGVLLSIEVVGRGGQASAVSVPPELVEPPDGESGDASPAALKALLEQRLGLDVTEIMFFDNDFDEFCLLEDMQPLRDRMYHGNTAPLRMQITTQMQSPRGSGTAL